MDAIEKYAVTLVGAGALSYAEDDVDEDGEFANHDEWRRAAKLGERMAQAVKRNPESFLRWYRETTLAEAVR